MSVSRVVGVSSTGVSISEADYYAIVESTQSAVRSGIVQPFCPLIEMWPENLQRGLFQALIYHWFGLSDYFDPKTVLDTGRKLANFPQFQRTDIQRLLYPVQAGVPCLGRAFLYKNFKVYNLLKDHPQSDQIDAEYIVTSVNYASTKPPAYGDKSFRDRMANALFDLLPRDLLEKVVNHWNLEFLVKDRLEMLMRIRDMWHFPEARSIHFYVLPAPLMRNFAQTEDRSWRKLDILQTVRSFLGP